MRSDGLTRAGIFQYSGFGRDPQACARPADRPPTSARSRQEREADDISTAGAVVHRGGFEISSHLALGAAVRVVSPHSGSGPERQAES